MATSDNTTRTGAVAPLSVVNATASSGVKPSLVEMLDPRKASIDCSGFVTFLEASSEAAFPRERMG